jgi:imidazoleglycerol-phosphate dehydratase
MKARKSTLNRKTKETTISVSVNLDGAGKTSINTGINFLDHLITSFGSQSKCKIK